jgi:hypothetical protein
MHRRVFSWALSCFYWGRVSIPVYGIRGLFRRHWQRSRLDDERLYEQSFSRGEKHMKQEQYELAIHEFEQAISSEPEENGAMVENCRLNVAYCYGKWRTSWKR